MSAPLRLAVPGQLAVSLTVDITFVGPRWMLTRHAAGNQDERVGIDVAGGATGRMTVDVRVNGSTGLAEIPDTGAARSLLGTTITVEDRVIGQRPGSFSVEFVRGGSSR